MPRSKEQFQELREQKKAVILDAALRLFAEKGFHGTSTDDIAKTADVSAGLIYHYFKSKEKILEEVIKQWMQIGNSIYDEISTLDDPFEKIKILIETIFKLLKEKERLFQLFISLSIQPGILKKSRKFIDEYAKKYLLRLENLFADAGFEDPALEAKFLDVFFDGIWMNYFFDKKNFPLEEMKRFLLKRYSRDKAKASTSRSHLRA